MAKSKKTKPGKVSGHGHNVNVLLASTAATMAFMAAATATLSSTAMAHAHVPIEEAQQLDENEKQELRHLSTLVKQIQRENAWSSHFRHVTKMRSLQSKQNINNNDGTVGVDGDDNGSRRLIDGEKEKEDLRVKVRERKSRQPIKARRLDEDIIGAGLSPLSSVPTLQNNYNTANLMRLGQRENGNDIVDAREEAMPMNNGDAELDIIQTSGSSHHQQQSGLTTILEEEKLNAKMKHEETTDSDAAGSQSQEELNQRRGLEQKPHRHNGQDGTIIENESNHYQNQILPTNQKERTLPEVGFPRRGSLRQRYSFNRRSKSGKPDYYYDDDHNDCETRDRKLGRLDGFAYWGEEDDDGVGGKSGKGDKRVTGKVGRPIARGKTGKRVGGKSGKSKRCPGHDGRRTPRPTPGPSKKPNNKPKPTPPPVRPWTRRPTAPVCSPDCPDCSPKAPLKCPEQSLKAVCDPGNEEVYPRGDSRAGERIASFKDCYQMCKPSFCCIHDSLSKEVAPSCAEEYENCPMWYPCYVIWWKLHDTIGPATYLQVEDEDMPFYEDVDLNYLFLDWEKDEEGLEFKYQLFGHHFDNDDGVFRKDGSLIDDVFEDEDNWR